MAAIEKGFQKAEIERSAYAVAQEIERQERTVVGVNRFAVQDEEAYEPLRVDPTIEAEQCRRLEQLRRDRDNDEVRRLLVDLQKAATGSDNVLYPMRDALRARATVGEVCHALREIWGTYRPADAF